MNDYDTVAKHLITAHPRDWVALAGMPPGRTARAVDTDLSTIKATPDKLIRVAGAVGGPYLAHVEFQAGRDVALDRRVMVYNVVAGWRHRMPVRSTVFLLRPAAAPPAVRGQVRDSAGDHTRLSFDYRLVGVAGGRPASRRAGHVAAGDDRRRRPGPVAGRLRPGS